MFFVTLLTNTSLKAQTDDYYNTPKNRNINPLNKGNILIDAFYGGPYLLGIATKLAYDSLHLKGYHVFNFHNYNQFGFKFQYLLNEQVDVGIEYTHALATFDYEGKHATIYTAGIRKQRILGKINVHFATSTKVDPYVTFGAGFNRSKLFFTEPGIASVDLKNNSIFLAPFSFRAGIGLRYFFTAKFGLNAEIGVGGPLMQAGFTVKL
jgi:opacity protein-like surface antigen